MSTHPLAHSDPGRPRARRISRSLFHGTAVSALALALGLTACAGGSSSTTASEREAKSATLLNVADETSAGGDPATAASIYRQVHDMSPKDPVPLARMAAAFMTMQDYAAAAQAYRAALALDGGNADLHRGLALALLVVGDASGAMSEIHLAMAKNANDPRLFSLMGVAQDMVGRHDLAQESYHSGIAIAPASAGLRNNYAMSLALAGDYGNAVKQLADIAGPEASPRYRLNLALAYGLAGDDAKAAATAREVLDDASVQNNLAYYAVLRGMDPERRTAAIMGAELRGAAVSVASNEAKPQTVALEHPVAAPPPVPVAVAPIPLLPTAQSRPASELPTERHVAALNAPTEMTSPSVAVATKSAPAESVPLDPQASFTPALQPEPLAFGSTVQMASNVLGSAPASDAQQAAPAPTQDATSTPKASMPAPKAKHAALPAASAAPAAPEPQLGFVPANPAPSTASTGDSPQTGFVPAAPAQPIVPPAPEPQIGFTPAAPATSGLAAATMDPQPGFTPAPVAQPAGNETSGGMTVPQASAPAPSVPEPAPQTAAAAPEPSEAAASPTPPETAMTPSPAPQPTVAAAEASAAPAPAVTPATPTEQAAMPSPMPPATEAAADPAPAAPSAAPAAAANDNPAIVSAPKPSAEAAAAPSPQPVHGTVERYAVQLGSFSVEDSARKLVDSFTAKGIAVTLFRANGNDGREWFVVRSRDFETADDATSAMKIIQSMGDAQPVLVHHTVRVKPSTPAA